MKDIVIIGGPNGAGKTTAAKLAIPVGLRIQEFVNADEIARGLSPFNPDGAAIPAARLMIERIKSLVGAGQSFAIETTCSGRTQVGWLRACKADGWRVTLVYLWLPTIRSALDRVARRVRQGGHDIPADVVARRWRAGLINMRDLYLPLADSAAIYDNSDGGPCLIAERTPDTPLIVHDPARWKMMEEAAQ
jgi:predicted ABC-type ATPase